MVLRVPNQPEDAMLCVACDLKFAESELVRSDAFGQGASIWKCATHTSDCVGYWIGHDAGNGKVELYAYLALIPRTLGSLAVLEGKKAWTDSAWRRRGLGAALLGEAAKTAPLQSDADGMTDMAFAQWSTIAGFKRQWWDSIDACFVDEANVPASDRFTDFENGRRWILVLALE